MKTNMITTMSFIYYAYNEWHLAVNKNDRYTDGQANSILLNSTYLNSSCVGLAISN